MLPPSASMRTNLVSRCLIATAGVSVALLLAAAEKDEPVEQVLRPPEPGHFTRLFQPFETERAALSPDGRYLAYSRHADEVLSVVIVDLDRPGRIKARVQVADDDGATPMLVQNQAEKTPARINWMGWVTADRLAVETNVVRVDGRHQSWVSWRGSLIAFDADGANAKFLGNAEDFWEYVAPPNGVFSVRRRNSASFDAQLHSPDQEVGVVSQPKIFAYDTAPTVALGTEPELSPGASLGDGARPRTPHIFDLDPAHPGSVTVLATGSSRPTGDHTVGFFSVDTKSGKITSLHEDVVLDTDTALLDRQGRARLTLPNSLLSNFPFTYRYWGFRLFDRPHPLGAVTGVDGFAVSPANFFGTRAIPLGFAEDPNLLYYASNLGRDTYGIYSYNLATKQRGPLTMENERFDLIAPPDGGFPDPGNLVFDRFTHDFAGVRYNRALRTAAWTDPTRRDIQATLEQLFPGRSVDLIEWDRAGRRYLFSTQGPTDAGAFFVFDLETKRATQVVRRAPALDSDHTYPTLPFAYTARDGTRITGLVTVPKQPRLTPVPAVILCPDEPWLRVSPDFQPEVQALTEMGFVVVQLNGRGAWGQGIKQRSSLTAGYDLVQVADIGESIGQLEKLFKINVHRIALLGRGHGGFIALRALQTYPEKFRCAVALDAPIDLGSWLTEQAWDNLAVQPQLTRVWLGDDARLKAAPLANHPEGITKPVLMLNYSGAEGELRLSSFVAARSFAHAVRSHGTVVEFDGLPTDYVKGLPGARAAVFDHIEAFLNTHVYDFRVKLEELQVVK
jgi:dipeptidyl aminopeptidase/acylaminoacyl peptidase